VLASPPLHLLGYDRLVVASAATTTNSENSVYVPGTYVSSQCDLLLLSASSSSVRTVVAYFALGVEKQKKF
jgi:hypothetical protein